MLVKLKKDTKYLISFDVKTKNLVTKRNSWPDGFMIYYSSDSAYTYAGITGNGTTKECANVQIPLDTTKDPHFSKARASFYLRDASGTVLIKNFVIEELIDDDEPYGISWEVGKKIVKKRILKLNDKPPK